jgi:hypothetical protein
LPPVHPGHRRRRHFIEKSKPPPPLQPLTVSSHLRPSSSSAMGPSSLPIPPSCYRTHQSSPPTTGAQRRRETPPSHRCKPPRHCPVRPVSPAPPHLARRLPGDPHCSSARPHHSPSTTGPSPCRGPYPQLGWAGRLRPRATLRPSTVRPGFLIFHFCLLFQKFE